MGDVISPSAVLPIAGLLALLPTAGLAAMMHLARRPAPSGTWRDRLNALAAASPWSGRDAGLLLLGLATAQLLRALLPASPALDVLALHGVLAAGLLLLARNKTQPFGLPLPVRAVLGPAVLRWLAVLPLLWAAALAWHFVLQAAGHAPALQQAVQLFLETADPWQRAGLVLLAVVIAPVVEEMVFRGLLLPLLVRAAGPAGGLAVTAAGFAALHGDLTAAPALAILSAALSLAYARTRSLRVPIAMHMLFNAANLALLLVLVRAGVDL